MESGEKQASWFTDGTGSVSSGGRGQGAPWSALTRALTLAKGSAAVTTLPPRGATASSHHLGFQYGDAGVTRAVYRGPAGGHTFSKRISIEATGLQGQTAPGPKLATPLHPGSSVNSWCAWAAFQQRRGQSLLCEALMVALKECWEEDGC